MQVSSGFLTFAMLSIAAALPAQAVRPIDVRLRGYHESVRLDTIAAWTIVQASPAQTYTAVRELLATISVPVNVSDSVRGVLFKEPFNTRREIMKKRMSWALNCGESINGPNADTYRIHMAYAIFLEPMVDKQQTRLGIALASGANTADGTSKPAVGCGSTGAFERELAMLVKARVQVQEP